MARGRSIHGRGCGRAKTPHIIREPSLGPPPSSSDPGIGGRGRGRANTSRLVGEPSLRPPPSSSDPPSLEASIPESPGRPSDPPSSRTPSMPYDPSPEDVGASDENIAQEHIDLPNDGRTLITITSDRRFYPDTVTRWILDLIRTHISYPEITFRKWPQAAKDLVFQQFMEKYVQQSQEKYGDEPSSQPMVDGQLWLDATGGSKKEKVIGFGNSLNKNLVLPSCASSSFSRSSTQESNSDCTSCGAFQAQVRDELREFRSMFQDFMISMRALTPNPPPPPREPVLHAPRHQQDEDEAFNENMGED